MWQGVRALSEAWFRACPQDVSSHARYCLPLPPTPACPQDVFFYGLPDHAHYYPELVNLLEDTATGGGGSAAAAAAAHATVSVLYCKWDALALARVVGAGRARKMLAGSSPTYMFM